MGQIHKTLSYFVILLSCFFFVLFMVIFLCVIISNILYVNYWIVGCKYEWILCNNFEFITFHASYILFLPPTFLHTLIKYYIFRPGGVGRPNSWLKVWNGEGDVPTKKETRPIIEKKVSTQIWSKLAPKWGFWLFWDFFCLSCIWW